MHVSPFPVPLSGTDYLNATRTGRDEDTTTADYTPEEVAATRASGPGPVVVGGLTRAKDAPVAHKTTHSDRSPIGAARWCPTRELTGGSAPRPPGSAWRRLGSSGQELALPGAARFVKVLGPPVIARIKAHRGFGIRLRSWGGLVRLELQAVAESVVGEEPEELGEVDLGDSRIAADDQKVFVVAVGRRGTEVG